MNTSSNLNVEQCKNEPSLCPEPILKRQTTVPVFE